MRNKLNYNSHLEQKVQREKLNQALNLTENWYQAETETVNLNWYQAEIETVNLNWPESGLDYHLLGLKYPSSVNNLTKFFKKNLFRKSNLVCDLSDEANW
jgi:hypothetical protein